jgi:hypothetical protein
MDLDSNYQSPDVTLKFRENERPYIEVRQDHGLILAGWVHPTPEIKPELHEPLEISAVFLSQLLYKVNKIIKDNEIIGNDWRNISIRFEDHGIARVVRTTDNYSVIVDKISWDTNDLKGAY